MRGDLKLSKTVAIIPSAGSGVRMKSERAKQFLSFHGRPLLAMTLQPFQLSPQINAIVVVVPSQDVDFCREEIVEKFQLHKIIGVIAGGKRRQDSVRIGIEAAGDDYASVLIHDGVRPLITAEEIDHIVSVAQDHQAVITGLPCKETIKEVSDKQEVLCTCDRARLWVIQTPQVFRYGDIRAAHEMAFNEGWEEATDDSVLVERLGIPVKVIKGSEKNIKVTTPNDLELAEFLFKTLKDR